MSITDMAYMLGNILNYQYSKEMEYAQKHGIDIKHAAKLCNKRYWGKCSSNHEWFAGILEDKYDDFCPIYADSSLFGYEQIESEGRICCRNWPYCTCDWGMDI